tara:strand:- start:246 stop:1442 length:1197 start_codon:yes stop_codon:yes gene_type:complete
MSTLSDLQKKLQQESEGIMFPFRTATVSTTQPVLDTATDGIMSITGQKYIGPDSVIQYSPEGQRQLKEIEKGMLPQFDQTQFPDIGKGKVEDRGGAASLPVDTTPLPQPEAPMIDPCPPGFKYDPVKKICVPVEQPKGDRDEPVVVDKPRNIGDTAESFSLLADAIADLRGEGGLYPDGYTPTSTLTIDNSSFLSNFGFLGKLLDNFFVKGPADKAFLNTFGFNQETSSFGVDGVSAVKTEDGKIRATFTEKGKLNTDNLMTEESLKGNLASTQQTNDDGSIARDEFGRAKIVGPIRVGVFGTTNFYDKAETKGQRKAQQQQQKQRSEKAARLKKEQEQRDKLRKEGKDFSMPTGGAFPGKGGGAPGYSSTRRLPTPKITIEPVGNKKTPTGTTRPGF